MTELLYGILGAIGGIMLGIFLGRTDVTITLESYTYNNALTEIEKCEKSIPRDKNAYMR